LKKNVYIIDCKVNPLDFRLKLDKIKASSDGEISGSISAMPTSEMQNFSPSGS